MKLTSWNCRGLGSKKKEDAIRDLIKTSRTDILLIQETKMSQQDSLTVLKNAWSSSKGVADNARGASGGLCTMWNSSKLDLIHSDTRMHWICTQLLHKESGQTVSLFNIYVPQHIDEKRNCWHSIQDYLSENELENIILGGDLNVTLSTEEKRGGSIVRDPAREWVEDLMSTWDLMDIKPSKGRYTWTNKRVGPGHIAARLDRFLVQSSFLMLGLIITSDILPNSTSDHKPIALEIKKELNQGPIPFRFNPAWLQHKDFRSIVTKVWTSKINGSAYHVWEEKLKRLKFELKSWAKNKADPTATRLESQKQLEIHQLALERKEITHQDIIVEEHLQSQWHKHCREEESYWRQKSRSLWLQEGDRNTTYFHKQAEARKQFKAVTQIQDQNSTITEPEAIRNAAFETFKNLYTEKERDCIDQHTYPLSVVPKLIKEEVNHKLSEAVTQQEIKEALDQMHPDKAPGPDGFTARFYQQCWEIIKSDLTKMIKKSQASSKLGGGTNSAFLALIPKEKGALSFSRFRPISLCNTSYKILTKVIANRLKNILPSIVPENQGGFIKGRHIADNIILVQEALHSSLGRKEKGMIIKLDLANAFDKVNHNFLFAVMKKFGFDDNFVNWIRACIDSPWIAPMVNGRVTNFFKASRGLRQGCPLSPLLYAIQASVLSYQLENARITSNLKGLQIAQGVKEINHAQFADDTLLLGGASCIVAKRFKEELDAYTVMSGSEISHAKSKIYSWNITPMEMRDISRILSIEGHTIWESFNYLGVPISKKSPRSSSWNHILDKLKRRISSWGANWLTLAGRIVLIKSVLASVPIYQNSLLLANGTVINQLEALQRRFLWEGGKQTSKRAHLISWDKVSKPFMEGGLSLKNIKVQNLALGAKLLWHIISGNPAWCKAALWKKYFNGPRRRSVEQQPNDQLGSPIFNLCRKVREQFASHLTWVPGNGKQINIWNDSILGDPPLVWNQNLHRLKIWMEEQNLKTLFDISAWGAGRHKQWQGWTANNLPLDLEADWGIFKLSMQGKAPIRRGARDKRGWGKEAKPYSTSLGYATFLSLPQALPNPEIWKIIWNTKTIPKVDMFLWTLGHKSIQTGENLQKKGWAGPFRCPLCHKATETTNHLLLTCPFSKEVWTLTVGLHITPPQDIHSLLIDWPTLSPFFQPKQSEATRIWQALPRFILWGLWLERNGRIFREKDKKASQVAAGIRALFRDWANTQTPLTHSRTMDESEELWYAQFQIQQAIGEKAPPTPQTHWELRTGAIEFINWKKERKAYILSFDGASKGNPGQAGGGGIIEKPSAEVLMRYAIGLGIASNNLAEALALWQGLCHAQSIGIRDLVIIGDSRLLIQAIVLPKHTKNAKLNNLIERIRLLLRGLRSFQIYHVLRALNRDADIEANRGVELAKGNTLANGILSKVDLP
jgi:ribonuclease HI/exonuclease III